MATGGFRSNATTDFLEEWKAKREKMRAKMLGDIAASTGGCNITASVPSSLGTNNKNEIRNAPQSTELNNNGNPGSSSVNCVSSYPVVRSSSSTALRRPEDDPHQTPVRGSDPPGGNLKKTLQPEKVPSTPQPEPGGNVCNESDKDSPSPGSGSAKSKEKKSSGPSARKGKGQIEKRKLREKRRSTGVVSIPSNESLDELDDDDGGDKERKREEALTQHNTVQNEAMTSDPSAAHLLQDTPRAPSGRYKSVAAPGSEEEAGGSSRHRQGYGRHGRDAPASSMGNLERRMEELEKELARERQENTRLLKAHQDKDELIMKLKEEIDLLNRDLDDIEDENEQLKQENKTLLKVVGQLTR
ncbi:PRKC apoptosis WT1 regulator protein [Megalops cyprinoides]|uniref:PRKC apoptosis WT1 regulator protein n=1 Tax=Megalops cyprinoides TaxID=118141 RepID=UPI001863F2AD|nr:PRKC apoptosis WT1 regulator protein [Megalops cyprinoides]